MERFMADFPYSSVNERPSKRQKLNDSETSSVSEVYQSSLQLLGYFCDCCSFYCNICILNSQKRIFVARSDNVGEVSQATLSSHVSTVSWYAILLFCQLSRTSQPGHV